MLATLLAPVLLAYSFPADKPTTYEVNVRFEGYVQVFGGRDTDVDVAMVVEATGSPADGEGNPQVVSEIRDAKVVMAGAELPFDKKQLTRFFPKTTISMSPFGKVLKTDAPDKELPIRLPALHPQRFPDITYLPIEFPAAGVEEGKSFTFKKMFGSSPVEFRVTPTDIKDDQVTLDITMDQRYEQFEDKFGNPVGEKENPATKVLTFVSGQGQAFFDRNRNLISRMAVVADAESQVETLATKAQTTRRLKTTLSVKVRENK